MAKTAAASAELSVVMLEKTTPNLQKEAEDLDKRRTSAFDKAAAAFANSQGGEDKADEVDDSD